MNSERKDDAAGSRLGWSKHRVLAYAITATIIALVFLPAVVLPYAHHDNVRYFSKPAGRANISCSEDKQYGWIKRLGRPLAAEIECRINFMHTDSLADLAILKASTAMVVVLSAWLLIHLFINIGLTPAASATLALLLMILPGVQNAVMMANLVNGTTLVAVFLAANVLLGKDAGWPRRLLTFLLLFFGFQCYPVWVFTFPILIGFLCLVSAMAPPEKRIFGIDKCLEALALFAIAAFASMLLSKAVTLDGAPLQETYVADISPAIISRILDKGAFATMVASKLWYLYWPPAPYVLITSLIVIWSYLASNPGTRKIAFLGIGFTALSAGIGILPWAIPKIPMALTRIVFPLSFALVLALAAGIALYSRKSPDQSGEPPSFLRRIRSRFTNWMVYCIAGIGVITAPAVAAFSATASAWASSVELRFVIQTLAERDVEKIRRVHVVRSNIDHRGYNGLPTIGDEFNRKTSHYSLDIADLVNVGLRELGSKKIAKDCRYRDPNHGRCLQDSGQSGDILVTQGSLTDPICSAVYLAIIDFSMLDHVQTRDSKPYDGPRVIRCP